MTREELEVDRETALRQYESDNLIMPFPDAPFRAGFNAALDLLMPEVARLREALEVGASHWFDPTLPENQGFACIHCDLGGAGHGWRGVGTHDVDCYARVAREALKATNPTKSETLDNLRHD